ncbi:3-hydroxybutyryl-CoA dehydrogenase [Marivirga sericea]|uniref:3-hydroxybutyryl-CoA dehydrogenase n=1 Tax=Marivirga sericea TaxID=1028 RepID=A0A1X7LG28_9BACT|nr:3-hydroxyacyl-CoA dehydrogenase NAD-binding domain-containing protein [Marivirga sericea]SMG52303.1 3-hydroxybutyryl-CoA dehydrogenase [Marivirga sericea]
MKLNEIKSIGIVGAGTMGSGIAQMSAMAGYKTTIFDIQEAALDKAKTAVTKNLDKGIDKGKVNSVQKEACLANISFISDLEELKADVIIEAVVEKLQVKIDIFSQLEKINSDKTILATNTSSIPITQIGAGLQKPERLVGMHFFNPAHIMKLVEVISGAATNPEIAATTKSLAEKMGKKAVMAKDSPGFIVNRVARHFYVESLKIAEENVANFEQIDRLVESSGFKMGPFRLMDLIGVDTNFSVTKSMFESFYHDSKFRPSRIQQQKVDAGHHGRKSGKGFYDYN